MNKTFDYKREYPEFYLPKDKPQIINIPKMNYLAVSGIGNPNKIEGDYQEAISILYAISFTIKMSYKTDHQIKGYFPYVVPPLEGFWWQEGIDGIDYNHKETYHWIALIRLPEFVTKEVFEWAVKEATLKKKKDFSKAKFLTYDEGLCVQCMHIGSYDSEPETIKKMQECLEQNGYQTDITNKRFHHEIYLSDPRKCQINKLRTVIRHPIQKKGNN